MLIVRVAYSSLTNASQIDAVGREVSEHIHPTDLAVIVDCSNLKHQVSSRFLGVLVKIRVTAAMHDIQIAVCGLSENLREVIEVANLGRILGIYPNTGTAIAELSRSSHPKT